MEERKTRLWWMTLSAIALMNVSAWVWLSRSLNWAEPTVGYHCALAGIYTLVCAFRSWVPRVDLERYCLVDHFISSMVVGRSAATVAEISFGLQIALLMTEMGRGLDVPWIEWTAIPVVLALVLAQLFCWAGVLTRNHLWHALEEALWAATFAVVCACLVNVALVSVGLWFWVGAIGALLSFAYVLFMVLVDVPMYVKRWRSHEFQEMHLPFTEGWRHALRVRIVTFDWSIWRPEAIWMTGYFTMAVWLSLAIMALPR